MNTNTAKTSVIESTVIDGVLMLNFSNGKQLTVNAAMLTGEIRSQALLHGLKQKLVDAAAIARNPETGRSATVADKFAAVKEVYDRLLVGEWNKTREGGQTGGLLLRALMQMMGKDRETVKAWLEGKTDDEKAALRKNPKVAAVIASLKPEPKTDGVDTDALLGELA